MSFCKMEKVHDEDMFRAAVNIMSFRKPDGKTITEFDLRDYKDRLFWFIDLDVGITYAIVGARRVKSPYPHALHEDIDQIWYSVDFAYLDAKCIERAGFSPAQVMASMFFELNALCGDYPLIANVEELLEASVNDGAEEREALISALRYNDFKYMNSDMISEIYWRVVPYRNLNKLREDLV